MAVNITFETRTAQGANASGTLRIEQNDPGSSSSNISVPIVTINQTTGTKIISFQEGSILDAWFISDISSVGFYLGRLTVASAGDFGTLVRAANGQSTGSQTQKTIAGRFRARISKPSDAISIIPASMLIDRSGKLIVPINSDIATDVNGNYSIQLPESSTLFSPKGDALAFSLVYRNLRLGDADFTIPSGSNLAFVVVGNSIQIQTV